MMKNESVLEKIYKTVLSAPERRALISDGKSLTYGELWLYAGRLAAHILAVRGKDRAPVLVIGHKDPLMIVSFLACVRAGHPYCPIDLSLPVNRMEEIAETIGDPLILSVEGGSVLRTGKTMGREEIHAACQIPQMSALQAKDALPLEEREAITPEEAAPRALAVQPEETFYIIFTSGSTGKPKGVEIPEASLARFTDWSATLGGTAEEKAGAVFLNQAPFSFDLSVMDLYTALTTGGTVFCLTKSVTADMKKLLKALRESDASYWVSTPSFAALCLADHQFNRELLPHLRAFFFCGETLHAETVSKLKELFDAKVINTYGPTESTVAVTEAEITREMAACGDVPIGKAKPGSCLEIDPATGELIIRGNTLAKGYYKDPEKTAESFFTDEHGRGYHTRDAVIQRDGLYYYAGRLDRQIKLHGYRIEPGDIEENIRRTAGAADVLVFPKTEGGKVRYLIACVGGLPDTREEMKCIKKNLKAELPDYMIPRRILLFPSFPLNANGKVDRNKLMELAGLSPQENGR